MSRKVRLHAKSRTDGKLYRIDDFPVGFEAWKKARRFYFEDNVYSWFPDHFSRISLALNNLGILVHYTINSNPSDASSQREILNQCLRPGSSKIVFNGEFRHAYKPKITDPASEFRQQILGTVERYETFEAAAIDANLEDRLIWLATILDKMGSSMRFVADKRSSAGRITMEFSINLYYKEEENSLIATKKSVMISVLNEIGNWFYLATKDRLDYLIQDEKHYPNMEKYLFNSYGEMVRRDP